MDGVRPFTIMLKDMEVMKVDFETLQYEILNERYLPYPVRGKLRKMPDPGSIKSSYDMAQSMIAARKNEEAIVILCLTTITRLILTM